MRRLGFVLLILLLIFTGDSRFSGNSAGDSLAAETVDNQHNEDSSSYSEKESHYYGPSDIYFWIHFLVAFLCIITGAFCSGMTVGLLSINTMYLYMMQLKANPEEQKIAKCILSVVSKHHYFLVTLLIANAVALESLPLVIHALMPDWAAILFSTFFVLLASEIVPQAYCTGPRKIQIAYYACPIISLMMKILFPLSWPVAKGLDHLLGLHGSHRIQHKDFAAFLSEDKGLKETETLLLTSTLYLRTYRVTEIMVETKEIYMIEARETITPSIAAEIKRRDFSYVLVFRYKRYDIIGTIKVKELALKYLAHTGKPMRAEEILQHNASILTVYCDTNLLEMLMLFQANSTRVALVCKAKKKVNPDIASIMYSKTDMIMKDKADIIGMVFLSQLFAEMAKFKYVIETKRYSQMHTASLPIEHYMHHLRKRLIE